ncbi:hypothetical protein ANRL1_04440 [Anaerolineae bacterium]|nr:hypothetical protein ANRL1_04440 [Anaerolineae bacterium]
MSEEEHLRDIGNSLHQRLTTGDVTATAEIAETFLLLVTERLRKRYFHLDDPHLVDTVVEDALISYFNRPEQYDPMRSSLVSYLRMSADGDIRNTLKKQKKNAVAASIDQVVELEDSVSEYQVADEFDLEAQVISNHSPVWQLLIELLPDKTDQEMALLMMENVRETEAFADVLGVSDRPQEEQAITVKRHKDRLKKTLQRAINPSELRYDG